MRFALIVAFAATLASPAVAKNACSLAGRDIPNGSALVAYERPSVERGGTCTAEERTCNKGVLSGSFAYPNCIVPARQIHVDGAQFRDSASGDVFVPQGGVFTFLLSTRAQRARCMDHKSCERHAAVRASYFGDHPGEGRDILRVALEDWRSNTIRLNLNQAALDPESPFHDPAYLDEVRAAVARARAQDLVVVLAPFSGRNERNSDVINEQNPRAELDTWSTIRAAEVLALNFGSDRGVILESLNEPFVNKRIPAAEKWLLWRDGGRIRQSEHPGVNRLIAAIRAKGATNVILLQGIRMTLDGFPGGIEDPMGQVALSIHPYFRDGEEWEMDWDARIGNAAESYPVILTEWNASARRGEWCERAGPEKPRDFLRYVDERGIGMLAFAFDTNFTSMRNWEKGKASVFDETCDDASRGTGNLIKDMFNDAL